MIQVSTIAGSVRSPLFLVHLAAIGLCLGLLAYTLRHRRSQAGARCFGLWLGATVAWIVAYTAAMTVSDPGRRTVFESLALAPVAVAAVAWLLFTLVYSGRWRSEGSRALRVLAVSSLAMATFVGTNPVHGLVFAVPESTIVEFHGVFVLSDRVFRGGYWLFSAYVYACYLVGVAIMLDLLLSANQLYRDQVVALVVAVGVPLSVATLVVFERLPWSINVAPLSFGIAAVPLSYSIFRSELLDLVPASFRIGERRAVETLDQGVIVLDEEDTVVFANSRVGELFARDSHLLVGRPLESVLESSPLEPAPNWAIDKPAADGGDEVTDDPEATDGVPRTLQHEDTGRTFEVMHSEVEDAAGPELGRTLFFRDVTDERRRKQRLLVLNRVVRHNLRNDMNVLRGHVRLLEDQVDGESVAVIDEIASELIRLGEKAHQMDRIIQEATGDDSPVNLAGIVDRVVSRHEDGAEVAVQVLGPAQAWTRSHGSLVEAIVSNLVENAVEHAAPESEQSRAPDAPVTVEVAEEDDAVVLIVTDNGPGIPEQEVATLMRGEVSALQHGSGIGLWMVKWCVDLTNATWEIDTEGGTRVTVRFPRKTERLRGETGVRAD